MIPANQSTEGPMKLRALPNWVSWKLEKINGKETKPPFIVGSNQHASATDPSTWRAYDVAKSNLLLNGKQGIGFAFGDSRFGAIDIDGCRNPETEEITPWADEFLESLPDGVYVEISPSGYGVKVFVEGELSPGCDRVLHLDPRIGFGGKVQIEFLGKGRYSTVTENSLYEDLGDVVPCDLTAAYRKADAMRKKYSAESNAKNCKGSTPSSVTPNAAQRQTGTVITSDYVLLKNGTLVGNKPCTISDAFGNSKTYPGRSEADLGFCTYSAIEHRGKPNLEDLIWEDYKISAVVQTKWLKREPEFRKGTIKKAIKSAADVTNATSSHAPVAKVETSVWGEPRKFEMGLPPVVPFNVTCLPHCLRPLVLDVSERVGVPVEFVAVALINALAGVVGRRAFVYPRERDNTWKESLNLWGGIIAGPGDKKTPLINAVLEPANRIRLEWDAENRAAQKQYKSELAAYKSAMKKIAADKKAIEKTERDGKKKHKNGEAIESQESDDAKTPAEVKAETFLSPPVEPINRVFMMNEATPEWLQNANAENPEGLFIVQDELAGWVAEQDATGRELERSLYLAAWNGNSVHGVGRVTRDGRIARLCWSLFGGFQPDTVRKFLEACLIVVDGTFPRFQNFVWPDPLDPVARKGVDRTPNEEAIRSVEKVFRALLDMKEDQVSLHFAKGLAREKFNTWYDVLNDRIYAEKTPHIQQHLAKYSGFMAILAGLFQLVDLVANQNSHVKDGEVTDDTPIAGLREIDADHVEQAIKLVAILESHARRIYSCIKSSTQLSEESLATHILAGDLEDGLTVRDIRRNNWKGLTRDDQIEDALAGLEELKWVREVETERSPKGGRPTKRWDMNPALIRGSNATF